MSVSPLQPVAAAVVNNAFVSRITDTEIVSIITLNNGESEQVDDMQLAINLSLSIEYPLQSIDGLGTIDASESVGRQTRPLVSSGGEIEVSGAIFPTGTYTGGQEITLIGTSDTNYVKISEPGLDDTAGYAVLNGAIELKKYVQITFRYISELSRWVEISRNI